MSLKVNEIATSAFTQSNVKSTNSNPRLNEPLLQFNDYNKELEVSDEKVLAWAENRSAKTPKEATEDFKKNVMKMLKFKDSTMAKNTEYYLNKLVPLMQVLNGVKKNNLKPNGNLEQNNTFEARINEMKRLMNDYITYIKSYTNSNINLSEDSRSGQYKLSINNQLLEVPERNVKIVVNNLEDMPELVPEIVD